MERLDYWWRVAEQAAGLEDESVSARVPAACGRYAETGRIALFWGGRELSPEAYLAVPTFIRRGLRPAA